MRFVHLSDLHIGKRVNHVSMLEDQSYILDRILEVIDEERAESVLIAGDVYDKTVPAAEAVTLFDDFLVELARRKIKVFVISGNHDSPERIAFASRLIQASGVYLSPVFDGVIEPVTMRDAYGEIDVYLLPFIKPVWIRRFFPEESIETYTDAVACVVKHMNLRKERRNILLAHQFVTGASKSGSEELSIGGLDNVDAEVFEEFDYVALGHIHGRQKVGHEKIRYCGTPVKYSFSEVRDKKSVTIAELKEKGNLEIRQVPLKPLHDFAKLRGLFADVMDERFYEDKNAYIQVTLLDEEEVPYGFDKLRSVYPNLMLMKYDNARTRENRSIDGVKEGQEYSPMELFAQFYENRNNQPLLQVQEEYLMKKIEKIWEGQN